MRLEPQTNVPLNNTDGYAYSFWFYDDNTTSSATHSTGVWLEGQTSGAIAGVTFSPQQKRIFLRSHGLLEWYDPNVLAPNGVSVYVFYEYKKLYNFTFLKRSAIDSEFWVNGKLAGYNRNGGWNYPGSSFNWIIDPLNGSAPNIYYGDLAYWDENVSDIAEQIYNGGVLSNWMNLSKKPKHYWRLGKSSGSKIYDIGTDGTNHLEVGLPQTYLYVLASVTGTNDGYRFGTGLRANETDPRLNAKIGDSITFRNDIGGHPLAIKDSNDRIVAEEDSVTKKTRWVPTSPGIYRYYCTTHPDTMGADIVVCDTKFAHNNIITAIQE